ncbi:DUF2304 domain-containing protein [Actinophytocola algeriensis]|uniref:DUF2304 domain-containing protein n=1 Tax=Actinophytocola algeriensis TaxID=1768010 RepID=A0A7W7VE53_9PSEU|nr:DUF2304 domain-containing protein [Actinophytocola algeriensis]MBB4906901.1 hypothetical protein [Actinophytocola algeriensis]MBE1478383.1 hypothetical protein [Actinophytocola algeriensis]
MSNTYLVALVGSILVLAGIVELLRRRQLGEKYAVLWLVVGILLLIFTVFPGLLTGIASGLGVAVPTNLMFFVGILFLVGVVLHLSWEVSRLENETRKLAEDQAILRLEVEQLQRDKQENVTD